MNDTSLPVSGLTGGALVTLACLGVGAFLVTGGPGGVGIDSGPAGRATDTADAPSSVPPPTARRTPRTGPATNGRPERTATTVDRDTYFVGDGPTETAVTVVDAARPGPTVVVVGGQHGNEPAGYRAAHRVGDWEVDRGTLVVIPEANPRSVENGTRKVHGRDLNAQFPVGHRPTSAQARVLWSVIDRHDADVVVDLHSSTGIYGVDGGVGQAVFPTVTGPAVENADAAIERVNDRYGLAGNHSFRRGNVMGRSGMTLTRKVAGDANETAYIVETTKRNTALETRVEWTTAVTWELLRLHGLGPGGRRADRRATDHAASRGAVASSPRLEPPDPPTSHAVQGVSASVVRHPQMKRSSR